jgi:hypothetical protein
VCGAGRKINCEHIAKEFEKTLHFYSPAKLSHQLLVGNSSSNYTVPAEKLIVVMLGNSSFLMVPR